MRNKIENVVLSEDIFMVHGILDDDIYSIELDLEIDSKTLVITEAKGKWHRHTTPGYPLSLPVLSKANGIMLEKGFSDKIHLIIGRESCRHFANLMIEFILEITQCFAKEELLEIPFTQTFLIPDIYANLLTLSNFF
ncbi:MAG: DUF2889 domain-containing protein [Desulfobacterales bacterium]|nr:DUF2889 domain-containing protein [Desulfobacterales bacterium]